MKECKDLLIKLEDKLEVLDSRLDKIDIHLERYNNQLEFHILRTNQNEEMLKLMRQDLEPIKQHVTFVGNLPKYITWGIGTFTGAFGVFKIIQLLVN